MITSTGLINIFTWHVCKCDANPLHTHTLNQDGATADDVAEVHGHQKVYEELRKHMHRGNWPLTMVSPIQK